MHCVAYARASGKANTSKLAITGFCWGGRIVWLYAAHNPGLKAGAAWYGRLVGDATELQPHYPIDVVAELKAPVIAFYGGKDRGITPESIEQMRAALENSKFKNELVVFPDAAARLQRRLPPELQRRGCEGCVEPDAGLVQAVWCGLARSKSGDETGRTPGLQ